MGISQIRYFDEPGPANTEELLKLAKRRVETLSIRQAIIASNQGCTVRELLNAFGDLPLRILAVMRE